MLSRNDLPLNARYPGVADALNAQPRQRFVVDGEVVSVSGRFQDDGPRLYHVFDVLWLDGSDVRGLPLRERKALLRDALTWDDPLRLVPYRNEAGEIFHTYSCFARGLDMMNAAYQYLDLTPLGRHEDGLPYPMDWVRLRDQYEPHAKGAGCHG